MAKRSLEDAVDVSNLKKKSRKDKAEKSTSKSTPEVVNGRRSLPFDSGNRHGREETEQEHKERRRLRRLEKEGRGERNIQQTEDGVNGVEEDSILEEKDSTAAAKAARKAEKAELKALKRAKKQAELSSVDSKDTAEEQAAVNGTSNGIESSKRSAKSETVLATKSNTKSNYQEDPALTALSPFEVHDFLSKNFITTTDPLSKNPLRPLVSFKHLPHILPAQADPFKAFTTPTPIQAAAWPFLLSGRDVVGVAETGSGKTLAFAVPCIRYITSLPHSKQFKGAKAVVVSPTRELALQIHEQIVKLATPAGLDVVCVYGGVSKDEQRRMLRTASIVVATPGRLNDLINEGAADLSRVGYLVLDEADRMLDKGFEEEIRKIILTTPPTAQRQTLMFTATWPPSVRDLASTFMTNPVKIAIGDNPTGDLRANTRIDQRVEVVDPRGKEQRLLQLIKQHQSGSQKNDRILVFCLYKKEATRVEGFLRSKGLKVAGIHGDLSQVQRTTSLDAFKQGKVPLLVATDVAARGLDIPAVKMVINVTFPLTVEDYVHRIGRTGRAGADGTAITLFTEHDKALSGP
jgi:ATP-dependent RNA helicase DBP3